MPFRGSVLACLIACSVLPTNVGAEPQAAASAAADNRQPDAEAERFFEEQVRPILAEHCQGCHGPDKQFGGLRVDSWASLRETSDSAPVIVPEDVEGSLLLTAVRREDGLAMPPDEELTADQIAALEHWVRIGAPWPASEPIAADEAARRASEHWAFQPVVDNAIPEVSDPTWPRNPIDAFVLAELDRKQLAPSPAVDLPRLLRRSAYAATGLPPSVEAIERIATASSTDSANSRDATASRDATTSRDTTASRDTYEQWVDELLESPQFGEHWARWWLDVARYSDSKGYVYAREHRFWTHAWAYRDWVVDAFNRDRPYDEFLLLQLAADQVATDPSDLAAMGFLTIGRRFLGVKHDIIDDRIDVVTRGMMGLTVACARCHDHKYDPIPTADYYSLYGVFDSCLEREQSIDDRERLSPEYLAELESRQQKLADRLAAIRLETSDRVRDRVGDYLAAQFELDRYPSESFGQLFSKEDLLPTIVRRWEDYLRQRQAQSDPVFIAWHRLAALAELPAENFAQQAREVAAELVALPNEAIHPQVRAALADPPTSPTELAAMYARLFGDARRLASEHPDAASDESTAALLAVLHGPGSPCEIPDESIVEIESMLDIGGTQELWNLQGEVDRWVIDSQAADRRARILVDRPQPIEPRIFRRGNPLRKETLVPRRFLSLLSPADAEPFAEGSGRLELARAIVDPNNPLTARVIVNRVWGHYFGRPLVDTPSDFGLRASHPSHPELLDWLAARLVEENGSLKSLHRRILLSATFRQASSGPADPTLRQRAEQVDPGNQWLWRWQPRRLSLEEMRDSLIAVTGGLDLRVGGKPDATLWNPPFSDRRTLYGTVDRQFLPGLLRVFDFANPDLHIPQRAETTAPQQALFFLNHPLVLDRVTRLIATLEEQHPGDSDAAIRRRLAALFETVLRRGPDEQEWSDSLAFLASAADDTTSPGPPTAQAWSYGYGRLDEEAGVTADFTPLPYFSGEGWQGGPQYPDPKLGWVRLDATGGHPGNDLAHAAIRRWTAPRDLTIEVRTTLTHEPPQGDGVRAAIVVGSRPTVREDAVDAPDSAAPKDTAEAGDLADTGNPADADDLADATGLLASGKFHQSSGSLDVQRLRVVEGQTIDFLVDIGEGLAYDQFLWRIRITETTEEPSGSVVWDAQADFLGDSTQRLSPWQQLAQILLCTNEFLFVP